MAQTGSYTLSIFLVDIYFAGAYLDSNTSVMGLLLKHAHNHESYILRSALNFNQLYQNKLDYITYN